LMEFRLAGVPGQDGVPDGLQPCIHEYFLTWPDTGRPR
jgi:hypothetical protein